MQSSIEIVTFKLAPEVESSQLLATNTAMQDFLQQQPGFIYRSLSYDESVQLWYDIIYWKDSVQAKAGGAAFMQSSVCASMMPLIDAPSCKMRHMDALSEVIAEQVAA